METNTNSMSPSAYSYSYKNPISFEKLMKSFKIPKEYYKIPKEYYKAEYYDNKHGTSVGEWLKLYKSLESTPEPVKMKFNFDYTDILSPPKPEKKFSMFDDIWDSKDTWDTTEKDENHLPDELFEI